MRRRLSPLVSSCWGAGRETAGCLCARASRWGRAGHVEQTVVAVLHLLEHLEQECAFFAGRLRVRACLFFPCGCRVECRAQQGIFPLQRGNGVRHQRGIRGWKICRILLRAAGARRCILEHILPRAAAIALLRGMQRIACSHEFGCIDAVIRIQTAAASLHGALERAAGHAAGACRVRDGELGHGRTSRAC
jgi:hypothetical protein